ncbi:PREDICTED: serine/threonine-protein kinase CDL1-like [Camelina sativa]|uniref:Serine/threonine-protein kinase CDL1-like n=1 Tax=Camelina sativa TaxID=90675 RepID=A0ABM0V4A0_CAMSA|nr:PREDICTED: serine/threonine-protein kinase CDL1-like [Camelina sativa]
MGFYEGSSVHPKTPETTSSVNIPILTSSSSSSDLDGDNNDKKGIKTRLKNMIFDLGLACFLPPVTGSTSTENSGSNNKNGGGGGGENNKAWLLAETAPENMNPDPHSVHSSFRFSLCSQIELEKLKGEAPSLSASSSCRNLSVSGGSSTVLMVNLENGVTETTGNATDDLRWTRARSLEKSISPVANTLVRFSYGEIVAATRNFSKGRVLGRGACSYVFRGKIGIWGTALAIKRLDKEDKESPKSFCRELMIASSLHSSNIVPLLGFCIDPEEGLFLVYKYVSGGSLEHYLHDKKKKKGISTAFGLPWSARYKVALGIADAIAYLHNGTEQCVVHRDIKPSNILLSSKKIPKLCDFGLATWTAAPSVPFLCKTVKGTFGYLAPEYFQHGKISVKTDVYAFGVVLLELITGRKPIEARRSSGQENLVVWAKPLLQRGIEAIEELLDPRLGCTRKNSVEMERMIRAAAACVINEESRRPGMEEIVSILKGEEGLEPKTHSSGKNTNIAGMIDTYTQLQQTKSEMKCHLDLAMLGVTELEDDDHVYSR